MAARRYLGGCELAALVFSKAQILKVLVVHVVGRMRSGLWKRFPEGGLASIEHAGQARSGLRPPHVRMDRVFFHSPFSLGGLDTRLLHPQS